MSIHTSLRGSSKASGSFRNVLKRHERVRHIIEQGQWQEGQSVLGLPKLKQTRMKARKSAAKEKDEATATAGKPAAAAPGAPAS